MIAARQGILPLFLAITLVCAQNSVCSTGASSDVSTKKSVLPIAYQGPSPSSIPPAVSPPIPSPPKAPSSPSPSPDVNVLPPTPSPSEAPPAMPGPPSHAPVPHSGAIKGGYWPSSIATTLLPSDIPTSYFTHIFYAFVLPDLTSFQLSITQYDELWMKNFTESLHANSPPAKAFLSIGGGSFNSSIFANMASNQDNRAAFIKSTIDVARKFSFDGLDLDWEFPSSPQEMSDFSVLFQEWNTAVNMESSASSKPRLLLSAAVYFTSSFFLDKVSRTYPGEAIREYVDFVNPMCYDYHGGWDPYLTGAHALLYDDFSNVSTSYGISLWKKDGVPSEKLVMGMPMYGRTWKLIDPNEHGIRAPANGTGPGIEGVMFYTDIVDYNMAENANVVYDEETVSTFSYSGINWIGYDNVASITNKIKFAKGQGLGGYFFWALGFDKNWTLSQAASMAWDGE